LSLLIGRPLAYLLVGRYPLERKPEAGDIPEAAGVLGLKDLLAQPALHVEKVGIG
jgi:hypothetical protein